MQTMSSNDGAEPAETDDEELRQLLRVGQREALSRLWERYADTLHRLLLAILRSPNDAEDCLQDLFISIARKRVAISESQQIGAYIYRMARNAGIDAWNRQKKYKQKTAGDQSLQYVQSTPGNKTIKHELQSQINQALDGLPVEQRSVVILKIYDQKTFYEIAEILDVSANTCASRYRYGMDKLRASLKGVWP